MQLFEGGIGSDTSAARDVQCGTQYAVACRFRVVAGIALMEWIKTAEAPKAVPGNGRSGISDRSSCVSPFPVPCTKFFALQQEDSSPGESGLATGANKPAWIWSEDTGKMGIGESPPDARAVQPHR